jgi:hypothetical protein
VTNFERSNYRDLLDELKQQQPEQPRHLGHLGLATRVPSADDVWRAAAATASPAADNVCVSVPLSRCVSLSGSGFTAASAVTTATASVGDGDGDGSCGGLGGGGSSGMVLLQSQTIAPGLHVTRGGRPGYSGGHSGGYAGGYSGGEVVVPGYSMGEQTSMARTGVGVTNEMQIGAVAGYAMGRPLQSAVLVRRNTAESRDSSGVALAHWFDFGETTSTSPGAGWGAGVETMTD